MDKCAQLYKMSIKNNSSQICIDQYKSYRNCLTKIKQKAKITYYAQHCYALKSNMSKLWQLINNVIWKTIDRTTILDYITVDNIDYYGAKDISNHFGKYYSEIGTKLANKTSLNETCCNKYLEKIKINQNIMFLHYISPKEIEKYINKLPTKDSSGYDNISNTLF